MEPPQSASAETKFALIDAQIDRIISDTESEKGTRARVNADIFQKLENIELSQRKTDRLIYMAIGGLAVMQFFLAMMYRK